MPMGLLLALMVRRRVLMVLPRLVMVFLARLALWRRLLPEMLAGLLGPLMGLLRLARLALWRLARDRWRIWGVGFRACGIRWCRKSATSR